MFYFIFYVYALLNVLYILLCFSFIQFHSWVFWKCCVKTGQKLQTQLKFTHHVLSIPAITEELAQEAFIKYVSSKCCYSSKPAKEMVFTDLQSLNTYRVSSNVHTHCIQLDIAAMLTFKPWIPVCTNSTGWRLLLSPELQNGTVNHTMVSKVTLNHMFIYNSKMKLYVYICMPLLLLGQVVDGFGGAPAPWSIPVPIPSLFQDCEKAIRVPHTSSVKVKPPLVFHSSSSLKIHLD